MLQDEARRRNRWRILVIAVLAFLNHWLLLTALGTWFALEDLRGGTALSLAGGLAALVLVVYVSIGLAVAPWLTMRDLGAQRLEPGQWPRLSHLVEEVAIATGTRPVALAALDDPAPNALTVGAHRPPPACGDTGGRGPRCP